MKLADCAKAYMALEQMKRTPCSYKTAHAMMKLRNQLREDVEYLQSEEMKIAKSCAVLDENGEILWTQPGRFQIRAGMEETFRREMQELSGVETKVEPVKAGTPPESITMEQLEALEGLLIFEEV